MKNYEKIMRNRASGVFQILLIIIIIFAILGWDVFIEPITNIAIWLITSVITTGFVQIILQSFTGDFLEKIPCTYEWNGVKISLTLFGIITIILKLLIF